ncbi:MULTISPECIES: DUF4332 domain-containing protein [Crocosphaera]|uniref:DUF4332 domain-containing protein n=6 Tax=Bacteria TaxID=2 RepID=T2JR04_CROWT|nr:MULTISPECIES: DUF4332 domain-containing protein [Crocosphaera]ABL97528.1 hypothetical protein HOT0_07D09.0016 [uncultured marine bacterium HOT0_07D09]EHJ12047.1 hypothetical protein CWATWH0003_3230 [Crocosphaera watsonii WH 0003]MCH2247820.1 DUF4332 domain-containing protein [Crocosphaera sp.]NQZ64247.1 DUF4332 domain-containing protein [Crocosphaera sp.]CCQ53410.1 FIG00563944: hypothetical protein [Crocosphaera watsonii WH 8502]
MQFSDWPIEQLPGLSKINQEQLKSLGINNTQDLLKITKTKENKQHLANQLKCQLQLINKWAALADLARVPSVGCDYCGLILHSGIISVDQLSQTSVSFLHQQILKLQVATLQRKDLCPSPDVVKTWINEARTINN